MLAASCWQNGTKAVPSRNAVVVLIVTVSHIHCASSVHITSRRAFPTQTAGCGHRMEAVLVGCPKPSEHLTLPAQNSTVGQLAFWRKSGFFRLSPPVDQARECETTDLQMLQVPFPRL